MKKQFKKNGVNVEPSKKQLEKIYKKISKAKFSKYNEYISKNIVIEKLTLWGCDGFYMSVTMLIHNTSTGEKIGMDNLSGSQKQLERAREIAKKFTLFEG